MTDDPKVNPRELVRPFDVHMDGSVALLVHDHNGRSLSLGRFSAEVWHYVETSVMRVLLAAHAAGRREAFKEASETCATFAREREAAAARIKDTSIYVGQQSVDCRSLYAKASEAHRCADALRAMVRP